MQDITPTKLVNLCEKLRELGVAEFEVDGIRVVFREPKPEQSAVFLPPAEEPAPWQTANPANEFQQFVTESYGASG